MIHIISAVAENRGIGVKGDLPWHLPEDLKRFKELTLGHPTVMGRTTFESIVKSLGKPLPGRQNIVMARPEENWSHPGAVSATSMEDALAKAKAIDPEVFVIGGAQIYKLALPFADILNLTLIHTTCAECDAFFPEYEALFPTKVELSHGENEGIHYTFANFTK